MIEMIITDTITPAFTEAATASGLTPLAPSGLEDLLALTQSRPCRPHLAAIAGIPDETTRHIDQDRFVLAWVIPAPFSDEDVATAVNHARLGDYGWVLEEHVAEVWAHALPGQPNTRDAARLVRDLVDLAARAIAAGPPTLTTYQRLRVAGTRRNILNDLQEANTQSLTALAQQAAGIAPPQNTSSVDEKPLTPAQIARAAGVSHPTATAWTRN